ncbi:MAG: hypothetical protein OQJ81_12790, partial [Melioribacteraceae bacterium]|nr:hypothetical protein [Melioribacteraceae bacterium]
MKISNLHLVILFWVISLSTIYSQKYDYDAITSQINNNFNIPSQSSINQDWEIVFSYDLLDEIGTSGFGGIVYDQDWDELWISSWGNEYFEILSLTDTSLTEITSLVIDGVSNVRGMTTDGEFVYAGNASDTIKIIDLFYNYEGEIIAPITVRYIAYDPQADAGNGGFWIGDWSTDPTLIDKNGNILRTLNYENLGTSNIYGGVYDNYSSGGPFLWLWGRGFGGGNPQTIVQIDIATGLPTGVSHDVMLDVGADRDSSVAGGLFITDQLFTDKVILGGILQGGGDRLFGYDISTSIIITTPPAAYTSSATNVSSNSATLNGTLNPNGITTGYSFEFGTTISYGTTISGTNTYTGIFDTDVSENVIDLLPNTTYHYRLIATNSDGTSYGNDMEFTTESSTIVKPTVTTEAASNITSNSARLNGTVNPNGSSTSYSFEYGTNTNYGITVSNGTELNGTTNISVNYDISGLSPNTTYHYRTIATNTGGTTFGNDLTFTTSSTGTSDVNLAWTGLSVSSWNWQVGNTITADLKVKNFGTEAAFSHKSQLYLSIDTDITSSDITLGNPISYTEIAAGDSLTSSQSFTVPSISNGVYYLGAIVDINNDVFESNENNSNYRTGKIVVGYPLTLQISKSVNFGDPTLKSSYKMIGIPGTKNIPITTILSGTHGDDWVAYYDNGATSDYLIPYNGTSQFNFQPGNGFWILSKSALSMNESSSPASLIYELGNNSKLEIVTSINLNSGWNIISNPFEINVNWAEVQAF